MSNFRYTRPDNFPPVIKNLIAINIVVWVAQLFYDRDNFFLTSKIGLFPIGSQDFHFYQIITHMFAHSSYNVYPDGTIGGVVFYHLLFNMFALWMFGRILENVWGAKRFLIFYILCGLGSAALHLGIQYYQGTESMAVGASGAIMGVMVAFAFLFPNTELYIMFIPVPVKAKWAIMVFAAIDLFGGIANVAGDNVAHFAHLGGALTGFIIVLIWNKTNRKTLY